jgi:ketosteroid isomerase-like protein
MPETLPTTVPQPISDFFAAANAFDSDGMIAPFTDDGLLNDIQREFWGPAAIKRWADKESVGDHVITTDFTDVKEHHGSWIISAAIDGEYDKTGLPDPLILTYYFTLNGNKIASVIIVGNKPGY